MRRLYVGEPLEEGRAVALDGADAHRVARVLRLRPGERIALFDGSGREAVAELVAVSPRRVEARVVTVGDGLPEPPVRLVLYQAVVKGERFEWALEKGTEVGVARFVPLLAGRSVVRTGEGAKLERWRRIVIEATEQCGRAVPPVVTPPATFDEALPSLEPPALIAFEGEEAVGLGDALDAVALPPGGTLRLIIGPEGGFAPEEVSRAVARGAQPVSLGPRILRSETAGVVASALALARLGGFEPLRRAKVRTPRTSTGPDRR